MVTWVMWISIKCDPGNDKKQNTKSIYVFIEYVDKRGRNRKRERKKTRKYWGLRASVLDLTSPLSPLFSQNAQDPTETRASQAMCK